MDLKIHNTFNKNDFIHYIEQNRIDICSYYELSKIELRNKLDELLTNECYLHFRKKTHCLNIVLKNEILLKCKKINPFLIHKIEPIISELKLKEINDRQKIKTQAIPNLQVKKGKVLVYF